MAEQGLGRVVREASGRWRAEKPGRRAVHATTHQAAQSWLHAAGVVLLPVMLAIQAPPDSSLDSTIPTEDMAQTVADAALNLPRAIGAEVLLAGGAMAVGLLYPEGVLAPDIVVDEITGLRRVVTAAGLPCAVLPIPTGAAYTRLSTACQGGRIAWRPEETEWWCQAYGPPGDDGPASWPRCFAWASADPQARCVTPAVCTSELAAARQRIYRAICEKAAAGDETSIFLAKEFPTPASIFNAAPGNPKEGPQWN